MAKKHGKNKRRRQEAKTAPTQEEQQTLPKNIDKDEGGENNEEEKIETSPASKNNSEMVDELSSESEDEGAAEQENNSDEDDDDDNNDGSSSTSEEEEEEEEEGNPNDGRAAKKLKSDESKSALAQMKKRQEQEAVAATEPTMISDGRYRNKQRCLVLCSRGVTARYRHLLEDLRCLLPHHKKDFKLDVEKGTSIAHAVNEIAEVKGCNSYIFLECRKKQDAYLHMGFNTGPSVKFYLWNVHSMDELRLTGNCMKGSRPILTFDESFSHVAHLKLLKVLFVNIFGTPRGHPKSKPFVDRVMGFYYADKKIWVRNYQILEEQPSNAKEVAMTKRLLKGKGRSGVDADTKTTLVEIGPRFVLNPIRIFAGSFGGPTLYQNFDFVSPNEIRSQMKKSKGQVYQQRKGAQQRRKDWSENLVVPDDPLANVFR